MHTGKNYILFDGPRRPYLQTCLPEKNMNTANTTQITSFLAALLITVAINGGMLMKFDDLAQPTPATQSAPTVVTLNTVTIVAHRG
jgi:hypothetical protein